MVQYPNLRFDITSILTESTKSRREWTAYRRVPNSNLNIEESGNPQ